MLGLPAVLLVFAITMALGAPALLDRALWPYRMPRLAIGAWLASIATGVAAVLGALASFVSSAMQLCRCGPETYDAMSTVQLVEAGVVFLGAWLLSSAVGAGAVSLGCAAVPLAQRARRTRETVERDVLATAAPTLVGTTPVMQCDEDRPLIATLSGRRHTIMVTTSARDQLEAGELEAAVEHELAHHRQHHGALTRLAQLQRICFPMLPGARAFERVLATLIELAADDAAARRCGRRVTASALERLGTSLHDDSMLLRATRVSLG